MTGFYLMHRGWMNNPVFSDEKFTERMAWLWMIEKASFEPHKIRYYNEMIEVVRGQIPTSYRKLKEAWKWSNDRVRGFLKILEDEKMIDRKIGTGFLVITICNYNEYQFGTGTPSGTGAGTGAGTTSGTNIKNLKNLNNLNKEEETAQALADPKKKKIKATRLPEDWVLPTEWGLWAMQEEMLTRDEVIRQEDKFRDFWLAKAGKDACKQDWQATWRNWIRRTKEGFK